MGNLKYSEQEKKEEKYIFRKFLGCHRHRRGEKTIAQLYSGYAYAVFISMKHKLRHAVYV